MKPPKDKPDRKEYLKKYRLAHKEKLSEQCRINYIRNAEERKEQARIYRIRIGKAKIAEGQRNWYLKNREKKIKKSCDYIKNNKIRHQIYRENRRATKKATSDDSVKNKSINEKLLYQQNQCVYCKCDISFEFHIDHIIPLSRNGEHTINNIQLLCPECNRRKNAKTHEEYLEVINIKN